MLSEDAGKPLPAAPPVEVQEEELFNKEPLVPKETFKISSSAVEVAFELR